MNLVTGATGFIGRHVARRLVRDGLATRVLCRRGSESKLPAEIVAHVEIATGDLRDRDSLAAAVRGVTRIFHCAGHVLDWGSDAQFEACNVVGTRWLYEAAVAAGVQRVVHLSSVAAFGTPSPPYFDDDSPYRHSKDGYSRSKVAGEQVALDIHRVHGLPVTILRPGVVYGTEGTWFEEPLAMVREDKMFLLGRGRGTCHPCYITNLVDAMLLAAHHPAAVGEGFLVGDGEAISFADYFNAIAHVAGKPPIRRSIPLPAARALASVLEAHARMMRSEKRPMLTHAALDMLTTESRMSSEKICRVLGFTPRYNFASAIEELRATMTTMTTATARSSPGTQPPRRRRGRSGPRR